jgi:endoglycosylceramidase
MTGPLRSLARAVVTTLILLAAIGLSGFTARRALASSELRVEGPHFRDAGRGVVVLRGVNVAGNAKVPPFRPLRSRADLDPLSGWGVNVIRLLFIWEAYESEQGSYDETYLDDVAASAQAAWTRGIYVVLDFHQDAFSRYSIGGCGDGFPKWALPPDVPPAMPDNGSACADWGVRMLGDMPMQASWAAFLRGDNGVRARFLAMVERVARRLTDIAGVIGYDIVNEPWGDEATDLAALHRDAGQAIRTADPTAILFLAPHALTSSGFFNTKLPAPTFTNAAYSPHYYDGSVLLLKSWGGNPPDTPFQYMRETASAWGVPLFVGEFGGPATTENIAGYLDAIHDRLNETFASAAQWVYTPAWTPSAKDGWNSEDLGTVDEAGRLRANFRIRPYARRIAGTPEAMRVTHEASPVDNVFELAWDHVPSAGTTEIFLPRVAFFGRNDVAVVTEGQGLDCVLGDSKLSCTSPVSGSKRVIVRSSGPVDGGPSTDDVATRDAEAPETSPHAPEQPSSGGCACTLGRRDPSRDAGIPAALLAFAVTSLVTARWSPRRGRYARRNESPRQP